MNKESLLSDLKADKITVGTITTESIRDKMLVDNGLVYPTEQTVYFSPKTWKISSINEEKGIIKLKRKNS